MSSKYTPFLPAVILLLYGYLCRVFNIYFFWEAKDLGWVAFWLSLILFIIKEIRNKENNKSHQTGRKIALAFVVFAVAANVIVFYNFRRSSACIAMKKLIPADSFLTAFTGPVKSLYVLPQGRLNMATTLYGETGSGEIDFVVKGEIRYADVTLLVVKKTDTSGWEITGEKNTYSGRSYR